METSGQSALMSRRGLLGLSASLSLWGCFGADEQTPWEISVLSGTARLGQGPHWIHSDAPQDWSMPLPNRGHGVAVDPRGQHAVLVARRPGTWLWIRDVQQNKVQVVQAAANRHFLGHAVFDASGRYLYVTENVFGEYDPLLPITELMRDAVIGVYDRDQGYVRTHELSAHGVGSHELRWMPDKKTLVVANGGIYTHPQEEREMLNPDHLTPSLVYIDAQSGELKGKVEPADPKLSMRHLCVDPSGEVRVGLQYQGKLSAQVPLVLSHRMDQSIIYWEIPEEMRRRMKQYTASVEYHPAAQSTAVSAPKAGAVLLFDAQGRFLRAHELADAAGLGVSEQGFVASSGTGSLELLEPQGLKKLAGRRFEGEAWDNHLAVWPRPAI